MEKFNFITKKFKKENSKNLKMKSVKYGKNC